MSKQLIYSQASVGELHFMLEQTGGDTAYLSDTPFASSLAVLESPTIDVPSHLLSKVNPESNIETAIALYEAYPNLNALEASSKGFWTYLTHVDLWDYMRRRFPLTSAMDSSSRKRKIKDKWFLGEPSQSSLMRHPLAGLWWGVRLSADESRGAGKYDFTRILFRDMDLLTRTLGTYLLARLPEAVRGILGYIYDHADDFKSHFEDKTRYIMKHFNSFGGVVHLGCLKKEFYMEELERIKEEWINIGVQ